VQLHQKNWVKGKRRGGGYVWGLIPKLHEEVLKGEYIIRKEKRKDIADYKNGRGKTKANAGHGTNGGSTLKGNHEPNFDV